MVNYDSSSPLRSKNNGLAVASMVSGIISLLIFGIVVLGPIAIILGAIAIKSNQINAKPQEL
jgi:hypothetical protein